MTATKYAASGKLLLFGEYLVLRGAWSLVMPLRYGQTLTVSSHSTENILWICFEKGNEWLRIEFNRNLDILNASDEKKAVIVQELLRFIQNEKPLLRITGLHFHFEIDFPGKYGLGTSSTFLSLLSQWSGVDPYLLLGKTFGGSGFDIAAATTKAPFIYRREGASANAQRHVTPISIPENISKHLLFIYTGKKQKSREEVLHFEKIEILPGHMHEMNDIIDSVLRATDFENFGIQMKRSETLLSSVLGKPSVKSTCFSDYPFEVKSLGAWGGDFVMATFHDEADARKYFSEKGMHPIFNYQQMIRK